MTKSEFLEQLSGSYPEYQNKFYEGIPYEDYIERIRIKYGL